MTGTPIYTPCACVSVIKRQPSVAEINLSLIWSVFSAKLAYLATHVSVTIVVAYKLAHSHPLTYYVLCHTLSAVGEQRDVHLHLKQTEHCHLHTVNDGDWTGGRATLAQHMVEHKLLTHTLHHIHSQSTHLSLVW